MFLSVQVHVYMQVHVYLGVLVYMYMCVCTCVSAGAYAGWFVACVRKEPGIGEGSFLRCHLLSFWIFISHWPGTHQIWHLANGELQVTACNLLPILGSYWVLSALKGSTSTVCLLCSPFSVVALGMAIFPGTVAF